MTVYAKTWCPAYPCDPCLVYSPTLIDTIGSDPPNLVYTCPLGSPGENYTSLPTKDYLTIYNYHEVDSSYFLGVRKWGIPVDVVPGSDPLLFSFPVSGMFAGSPLPLSDVTITYGGSVVLTVPGAVTVTAQGAAGIPNTYPDGATLFNFSGYIELPSDVNCIRVAPSVWEFHYDGPYYPGPVSIQYDRPVRTHFDCYYSHGDWLSGWQYTLSTLLQDISSDAPPAVQFYRTECNELGF